MLVLGGDIGGTATRILVADGHGAAVGRGAAGGGNPTAHPATAATAFGSALGQALTGIDASDVRAGVVGLAGGGALQDPALRDAFARTWTGAGLSGSPEYVSDLDVAFASGTAEPDGSVLIAGTGASAAAVTGHRVARTAGGHGWLLGDEGSGFWLGREAVRATLRTLEAAEPPGPLAESVLKQTGAWSAPDHTGGRSEASRRRVALIQAVNAQPPIRMAELAPLVTAACGAQDPAAADIVERAALLLADTVARVRSAGEQTPLVLAGRVVAASTPVGTSVRRLAEQRFAGSVCSAQDGLGGAAWLALAAIEPDAATPAARARLVEPVPDPA